MVAEPVQATLGMLRAASDSVTGFWNLQVEKLPDKSSWWISNPFEAAEKSASIDTHTNAFERLAAHVRRHKVEAFCVAASSVSVALGLYHYRLRMLRAQNAANRKRRRVPKLPNGARRDVVLVVGSPTEPLTRLLAIDFEKRGFIVYLTILDEKDMRYTQSNSITDDIHFFDLTGGDDTGDLFHARVAQFRAFLRQQVAPIRGAEPHLLKLSAVVFTPNLYFPLGPVENIAPALWERIMARFSVYTTLLASGGLLDLVREQGSKIVCIVPTIVSSLRLSYHVPETVFQNSVKDLFTTLCKELKPHGIYVTQVRLGNLNLSRGGPGAAKSAARLSGVIDAEVRSWSESIQSLYGHRFLKTQSGSTPIGSPFASQGLRGLHHLLFDLILSSGANPALVYYGSGARSYERLAGFLPSSIAEFVA